jgi:anaerobic ribonucleoside-triphosphate reductase activating protein
MNYGKIKEFDIADGPGVRVSLFVSGCRHHCKGCFQPETWNFNYGEEYTEDTLNYILELLSNPLKKGLTVLGGEPFEKENQKDVCLLMEKVKEIYPDKSIWCYSGYTFDVDMKPDGKVYTEYTDRILKCIDVLVDGEFMEDLKDITLKFRGSSNQRLIDIQKSLKEGNVVLWQ